MNILALDLGTHCGMASYADKVVRAETWTLATPSEVTAWGRQRLNRRCDPRMERFRARLLELPAPEMVVFEDVEFSTYTLQCQLWSAFRTVVWMTFGGRALMECVPVTALKKYATGNGMATKEMMSASLQRRHAELWKPSYDDNAIDALWLLAWAQEKTVRL